MLVKLENEYLTVLLNTKGAELSSVKKIIKPVMNIYGKQMQIFGVDTLPYYSQSLDA